ncbi:MAG: hypothetical protein WC360_04140 [Opitutales bacterium]|jgi:PHP family Zn ribbon phosphoesterase
MEGEADSQHRPFLGVYFDRCGAYGRFYKNKEGTAYIGRCPRCGASFKVRIGSEGTHNRFFKATCPGS